LRIPLKEGIGSEIRGDRGETESDFTDNSILKDTNMVKRKALSMVEVSGIESSKGISLH
jgi:hypothetical protein